MLQNQRHKCTLMQYAIFKVVYNTWKGTCQGSSKVYKCMPVSKYCTKISTWQGSQEMYTCTIIQDAQDRQIDKMDKQ